MTRMLLTLVLILVNSSLGTAKVYMESDITCTNRSESMQVYIQSKTRGITKMIRTIDSNNDIIVCGTFETEKGIGARVQEVGQLSWGYLFPIPCQVFALDSKQENIMFGLKFVNRGIEFHNIKASDGSKNYIYEYQNEQIQDINYAGFNSDYYWFVFHENTTTDISYIIKISKTRRFVYQGTTKSTFKGIVFPSSNPIFVGHTLSNEPYLIQINSTSFKGMWNLTLTNVVSNQMMIRNKADEDLKCIWALNNITDDVLIISALNVNDTSVTWSKTYPKKFQYPNLAWAAVFEEYVLVGRDPDNQRH